MCVLFPQFNRFLQRFLFADIQGYWSKHILSLKAASVFKHPMILFLMWFYLWVISSQCILVSTAWSNDFLAFNESSVLEISDSDLIDSYFTATNWRLLQILNIKLAYNWQNSEVNILSNVFFSQYNSLNILLNQIKLFH